MAKRTTRGTKTTTKAMPPPHIEPADAFQGFDAQTTRWNPQNARALLYCSDLAYKEPDSIQAGAASWGIDIDHFTVIRPSTSVLQAVVLARPDSVILAFRGTRPDQLRDWMSDFEISQSAFTEYFSSSNVGNVHDGFAHLLAKSWKAIRAEVLRFQDQGQTLWITGHSLGGALAAMATAAFTFAERLPVNGLYTFGQPRIGDLDFCTQCDSHFGDAMFRFVNDKDIVTRVPPRVLPHFPLPEFYGHCGQLRFFDQNGLLKTDEHWWNAFLLSTDVGFENMGRLLSEPVADHALIEGYAARLEKYLADLKTGKQPAL
jgi:triacylglycerol lipase